MVAGLKPPFERNQNGEAKFSAIFAPLGGKMSSDTSIYIQSTEKIVKLSRSLEKILQVRFRPYEGLDRDNLFVFTDPSIHTECHLEEDEDGIDYITTLDFHYRLNIHSRSNVPGTRETGQIDYAKKLFQQLRDSGLYPLLLLHNYEEVLDEYIPEN